MQDTPTVSVIIPVYNAAKYLAEAVDSILAQTFEDFELILVNDGSTDHSEDILNRYTQEDSRVTVLSQLNGGVSKSCNAGIAIARGRYIARMDADDVAWPSKLGKQVRYLTDHPEIVALGTQFRLTDPAGRALRSLPVPTQHDEIDLRHASGQGLLSICNPSVLMHGDTLRALGGYDEEFRSAHDIELFLRMAEVGQLANLDEVLLDYRLHDQSIGHLNRPRQLHFAWEAARRAAARRGSPFTEPEPNPNAQPVSKAERWRKWGWWALMGGNVATARHYALRALCIAPFAPASWRLAIFALRGY